MSTTVCAARRLLRYRYIGWDESKRNTDNRQDGVLNYVGSGFRSRSIKRNKKVMNGTTEAARGSDCLVRYRLKEWICWCRHKVGHIVCECEMACDGSIGAGIMECGVV